MSTVKIADHAFAACERGTFDLPVTYMANGYELTIPVHVVNGAQPGPKMLLTALSHGDATTGFECIRQVLETVDEKALHGTIVAVPCQNPVGFEWDARNTPVDSNNMNRCYPGRPNGWFTEQVAGAISPLCKDVDFLIDWHGGGYGTAINYVLLSREEGELGEEIHRMGRVYGLKLMYDGAPAGPAAAYAGTLTDYMISLGKPAIVAEVGTGICLPMDIVKTSVRGVFNVMKYKGMIEGKPEVEHDQYLLKDRPLLRPHNGGMFYPLAGPEMLNGTVPKGTPIAEIRNVRTMEVIETMYAPCEETAFLMLRGLMTKVHPGDYAYILADLSTAEHYVND